MTIAAICMTIEELFDLFYDTKQKDVPNPNYKDPHPNYKDPHPNCEHYKSVNDIGDDLFCPKCGSYNKTVTHPKTLAQSYYTTNNTYKTYFSENGFIETSDSKEELIRNMLWTIKSTAEDKRLHLNVKHEKIDKIEIDASENGFIWFSSTYEHCNHCYFSFPEILETSDLISYKLYLICFELKEPSVKMLKDSIVKIDFFEQLGLTVEFTNIKVFDYHSCPY